MVAQSADKLQRNGEKEIVRTTSLGGWVGSEVNVCKKLKLLYIYIDIFTIQVFSESRKKTLNEAKTSIQKVLGTVFGNITF